MSRGLTWCNEEVKCLIEIWADEQISQMLDTAHKNYETYKIVSEWMKERDCEHSVEQCCERAKKLRQQYIKIRGQLAKSGGSTDEKDKFTWFDELSKILGTKPVVEPEDA